MLLAMLAIAQRAAGAISEAIRLDLVRERIDVQRRQLSDLVRQPPELTKAV